MTWIDERLFGWSRSAKRGTSAWGGFSGDEASRIGTPDESDDEDTGDYDNVVGILPMANDDQLNTGPKSRSRQSSYADLQRLRLSPFPRSSDVSAPNTGTTVSPAEPEDSLSFRHGHRTRRKSLSDGIPVTRIAAVDRTEPFMNATHDLNEEAKRNKTDHGHA
jgi:glycerol-3-phosphate O-acyltransferase/dihydroxyacetone phosphate acyltransferase